MSTLTSVGPMLIMDGARPALPQAIPSAAQCIVPQTPIGQYMTANGAAFQHHLAAYRGGPPAPSSAASANGSGSGSSPAPNATSTSMNRSQRCGVCRGCQCKPCGNCTYCQDSPQFGGPGVKKQSCIERRCLRVLENRLQRDVPGFKARAGCNNCDDCRMPDCQICLVCLDRRFFDNRYMPGALCAKKRCNNATSLELPPTPGSATERQGMKRSFDSSHDYTSKRRGVDSNGATHSALGGMQVSRVGSAPTQDAVLYAGAPPHLQTLRVLPPPPPHALAAAAHHMNLLVPMGAVPTSTPYGDPSGQPAVSQAANGDENPASSNGSTTNGHSNPLQTAPLLAFQPPNGSIYAPFGFPPAGAPLDAMAAAAAAGGLPPHLVNPYQAPKIFNYPKYEYYENDSSASPQDPFVPPSYAPEMKNAVVLQPL